ncbi:MAG: uracil permease [Clostridia bacterium]|jgi:uracil permease|nr:uracil-xanthine permease [Clostridiales bacterium]MDK2985969.1 uracil permease [Clostridia bacterium]
MKNVVLSFQHVLAMFGATVLVPLITGIDPATALLCAGLGTLAFHLITKQKVPAYLGSSFAFIPGILAVKELFGLPYATGAMIAVGGVYVVMALIVSVIGIDRVKKLFPPIVTGPIIIVIGLILAPVAIQMASEHWTVAIITMLAVAFTGIYARGFLKFLPILFGIIIGYISAVFFGLVDFTPVKEAAWFGLPTLMMPQFNFDALSIIVPIALVTMIEHIGDIASLSGVTNKNYFNEPGLNRTLLGDGIATALAGALGGPANTTYGENIGVLAITKNFNPRIIQGAALIAIAMSLIGKFGALLSTIPTAVLGGVSFILFGMIASVGIKTLVDSKPDLTNMRNSVVVFVILIIGIASIAGEKNNPAVIQLTEYASLSGLSLAALVGIILNAALEIFQPQWASRAVAKLSMKKQLK